MSLDDYSDVFDSAGTQYGVDPNLLRSIAQTESSGNPNAVNKDTGATGLMQLLPSTAKSLGVTDPTDPVQAINGAAQLMAQNLKRYKNPEQAIKAYHGGTDQANWGPITDDYLDKVKNNYQPPDGGKSLFSSFVGDAQAGEMPNISNSSVAQSTNPSVQSTREMLLKSIADDDVKDNNASPELNSELENANISPTSSSGAEGTRARLLSSLNEEDRTQNSASPIANIDQSSGATHTAGYLARAGLTGISGITRAAFNLPTNIASAAKNAYEELTTPEGRAALGTETAPFKEPLSAQDFSNQLTSAGLATPQDRPERLISDVVEGATGGATGGSGSFVGALGGALGGGGSGYVREQGGTPGQQLAANVAGNLLIPGAGSLASAATKEVNPLIANAAKQAEDQYGIKIPNAQLTNSSPVKFLSGVLPSVPFSGAGGEMNAARSQFGTAISHTIGEDTPNLTKEVMDSAGDRIGKMYDSVADSVPAVKVSDPIINKLSDIDQKASETLLPDEYSLIKKQIDNIKDKSSDGSLSSAAFKNMMDSNSSLTSLTKSGSTGSRQAAYGIKSALYGALGDSAPDDAKATLQQANQYYKNYKTIEPLADKDPITGEINPVLLLNKVNQTSNKFGDKGFDDLQNLAGIGNKFFRQVPSSGTSERTQMLGYLGAGGAGGVASHVLNGDIPAALGTLGTLGGTVLAARGANAAINSQAYRNMLLNNSPNYLPAISGGIATNRLVNP